MFILRCAILCSILLGEFYTIMADWEDYAGLFLLIWPFPKIILILGCFLPVVMTGIGGRHGAESVVALQRNGWSSCTGFYIRPSAYGLTAIDK